MLTKSANILILADYFHIKNLLHILLPDLADTLTRSKIYILHQQIEHFFKTFVILAQEAQDQYTRV